MQTGGCAPHSWLAEVPRSQIHLTGRGVALDKMASEDVSAKVPLLLSKTRNPALRDRRPEAKPPYDFPPAFSR
jgi:hypothetical protein